MENIQSTLQDWGDKMVSALRAAIPGKDTNGLLGQSIGFTINYAGFPIVFELQLADYYQFLDSGRAAGKFPPSDVIAKWIQNKQLTLKTSTLKNQRQARPISNLKNIQRLSFLIGRKIARDGILPTHFYSNTMNPDIFKELTDSLSEAFKRDVLISL